MSLSYPESFHAPSDLRKAPDAVLRAIEQAVEQRLLPVLPRPASPLQRAVCLLLGHDKWISASGDWSCMRCGIVRERDFAPIGSRSDLDD